jgi:hypothetical protein
LDTLQNLSFIDIIQEILNSFGGTFPVRVNSRLYPRDNPNGVGQTALNRTGFYTELFWTDNVERETGAEILSRILTAFNSYLYWQDGYWYIERYEDIWRATVNYVEYTPGVSYGWEDAGAPVTITKTTRSIHSLNYINQTQTLHFNPGLKNITIELEDNLMDNLVINDLSNASLVTVPGPQLREWNLWVDLPDVNWDNLGESLSSIENSARRYHKNPGPGDTVKYWRGMHSRIRLTVDEATQINIKWKFVTSKEWMPAPYPDTTKQWGRYVFKFHWYLADNIKGLLVWSEANERYEWAPAPYPTDPELHYQTVEVPGSSFDENTSTVEVSVSVPLNFVALNGYSGNQQMQLCIGIESCEPEGAAPRPCTYSWWGDVQVTVNGNFVDNVLEGVGDELFVGKKSVQMKLFDVASVQYKNAILVGEDFYDFTVDWTTNGSTYRTLAEWLLSGLFRLLHKNRQIFKADVQTAESLQMFQQYQDEKQPIVVPGVTTYNKMFLLTGYEYDVLDDSYRIEMTEYDNITPINF